MPKDDFKPGYGAARYKYDTAQIAERERFDYYREVLGQNVLKVTPERPVLGTISVTVEGVSLENNVSVSRVELSPHLVRQTVDDLSKSNQDLYYLGLHYDGTLYWLRNPLIFVGLISVKFARQIMRMVTDIP